MFGCCGDRELCRECLWQSCRSDSQLSRVKDSKLALKFRCNAAKTSRARFLIDPESKGGDLFGTKRHGRYLDLYCYKNEADDGSPR